MKKALAFGAGFIFFFFGAFSIYYFADDFYFLKRSSIHSFGEFAGLFTPAHGTFYRPLSSELFYLMLHAVGIYAGKLLVFAVFFAGIYFLYRSLRKIAGLAVAVLAVILYSFHFSHVFQLYWFATFQEVALFATLSASFYFFHEKKYIYAGIGYILALFCKEQAILFPAFLLLFTLFINRKNARPRDYYFILSGFILSLPMLLLYLPGVRSTSVLPEYQIHASVRLIFNNAVWYTLWSLGFPSMMPDYMVSLARPPLPQFYRFFANPIFTSYFILMLLYLCGIIAAAAYMLLAKKRNLSLRRVLMLKLGFLLFIGPALPIFHKWMVRLTIPLVFVSIAEAVLLAALLKLKNGRYVAYALIAVYMMFNFLGVKVHEESSTYHLETRITRNAKLVFAMQKQEIESRGTVAIRDDSGKELSSWAGVEKLKVSFAGQNAAAFYFPGKKVSIRYLGKGAPVPTDGITIPASAFFK